MLASEKGFLPKADVIVSNSVLHHLHKPEVLWKAVKNSAKKECITFHRDLKRPKNFKELEFLSQSESKLSPEVLKRDFLASLKASFTVDEVRLQIIEADLPNLKVSEISDKYLQIHGKIEI